MNPVIVNSTYFTQASNCIGIVIVESQPTKELKAYIGLCEGYNQQSDEKYVAEYGAPFPLKVAQLLMK